MALSEVQYRHPESNFIAGNCWLICVDLRCGDGSALEVHNSRQDAPPQPQSRSESRISSRAEHENKAGFAAAGSLPWERRRLAASRTPLILEDGNLPRIAAAVRAPIKEITPDYVAGLPEWVAGLEDRRWIVVNMDSFLEMDLAGTSWQSMSAYTKHDFGFGLPSALRWPNPAFEGYVPVFPSRAGVVGGDEGSEVCVCLEETSADRLMSGEMLLRYAQPRV